MEKLFFLDTNIWIYFCNGTSFVKDKDGNYSHIKMFEFLTELENNNKISIFTNDIIIQEWTRNKEAARSYIKRMSSHKKDLENKLKKNTNEKEIIKPKIQQLEESISKNEAHINNIEQYLLHKTLNYPITNNSKIIAANQAIAKKAPFIGKKSNSMADMVILLSAIEFVKSKIVTDPKTTSISFPASYFVSANKADFSSKEDEKIIHPDISPYLDEIKMKYNANLGELINSLYESEVLTKKDISNYQQFIHEEVESCLNCDSNLDAIVCFNKKIEVRDENKPIYDEKQYRLNFVKESTKELNKGAYVNILEGCCNWCGSRFILCGYCDEMIEINENENVICNSCGATYKTSIKYQEKDIIYDLNYTILKRNYNEKEKNEE